MKVAIIGSGPAGLASARFLVQAGIIPKIFSSDHNVGGLWKEDRKENIDSNQKCWKSLHTNLSKYTCSFSDFPWLTDAPMFPSFHDMHKYLKAYTDYYLKPEYFSFCSTVIKTSRNIDGGFLVEWMDEITNQCHTEEFNAVVVASGFHNDSIITESVPTSIPYIHSSAYRSHERYHNKRVVVVGASYSATEISAEISQYTKSVYNIQSRPIYTIPRFIPSDPLHPASPRLPLDMVFYTVNTKDIDAEVWNEDESVLLSQPAERLIRSDEDRSARKAFFDKLVYGVDYNDINKDSMSRSSGDVSSSAGNLSVATRPESNDVDLFPFASISDTFNQQQLAKKIEIVYGRYLGSEGSKVNVLPSSSSTCNMAPTTVDGIHDVDEIIFCTGMRPRLDYLDTSILQAVQYEKEDAFLPVVLYKETLHPDVPGLYFIGCHKGPYFAVIELQAVSSIHIFTLTVYLSKEKLI